MTSKLLSVTEARMNVNYLAALDFIISLGFGLIFPLFPVYAENLGANAFEIGIIFAAFVLTRAIFSPSFGNLSDRIGRKRLILIGSSLYVVFAIWFTIPESWIGLMAVRGFQGVASAMVWPVSEALVIDSTPQKERGAAMGKMVMASNLGFVIGPFVGGGLVMLAQSTLGFSEMNSYRFPFYFTAILAAIATLLVWVYVTDARTPDPKKRSLRLRGMLKPEGIEPARLRDLRVLYLNAAMEGFSFSSIGPLMALFLMFRFDLGAEWISILIGLAMGLGALVAFPSGRLSDRWGRKKLFVGGGLIAFSATLLIPTTWSLVIIVCLLGARSMAFQVASPALRALQADVVPEHVRGRLIGVLESMSAVGAVIGAPIGGIIFDLFYGREMGFPLGLDGTLIPFAISGALGIGAVTLVQLYVRETIVGNQRPIERLAKKR
ncbi:MAG: MFS transporter [Methanobacteriota archaeon]|nr:MAG: MFS transporter [Euryarchaeota archaeon]